MVESPCEERRPLWHDVLLAVAPVVAGVAAEAVRDWLNRRREQRDAAQVTKAKLS